ncbi:MAG TPA: hypothetical protein DHU69_08880 [Deltaproteobacteria bacterium]|nr:MAG: hypothetical protein A2056_04560 [Deltaproteobacteria bacterium GWA2_42_85]HCY19844.1 hypothetical protein [Deltaproteobacteria bacterium]
MKRRYLFISIVLAAIAIVLGVKLFEIWLSAPTETIYEDAATKPTERTIPIGQIPSTSDYQAIIEKDIFRPSRTKPAPVLVEVKPTPRFNLYGVIMVGEKKRAILGSDEPQKKPQSFKIGDAVIEGYMVADILRDRVVLKRGAEQLEIALKSAFINLPSPWKKITGSYGVIGTAAASKQQPSSFFQIGDKAPIPGLPPAKPSVIVVPAPTNTKPPQK